MEIKIQVNDKYDEFLKDLAECTGDETIEGLFTSEIMAIIHENLEDYGYDKDGNKFYIEDNGTVRYEDEELNDDPNEDARVYYNSTRGV